MTKSNPNPEFEQLDAGGLLETLVERDPSFAEGAAIYDFVDGICSALKLMRSAAGLKQAELAKRLDLTQGRISQIESGLSDHAPNLETIARYAVACGFTPTVKWDLGFRAGTITPASVKTTSPSQMPAIQIGFIPRPVEVESGSSS